MKKTLKNSQMVEMLNQLRPLLSHRDKLGYIAARNFRMLSNCLTEYSKFRSDLIEKYGTDDTDEDGRPVVSVKIGTPEFFSFCDELSPYNEMEHEVELMSAKYEEAIGCLSGEEILAIDWMLED